MRRKLIVGNWKMNGNLASNIRLFSILKKNISLITNVDVVICVPTPYLAQAQKEIRGSTLLLGAQDVSAHESGAYTGEVSAPMLIEFGCKYVIIGHSERRIYHNEINKIIADKVLIAITFGLIPIICVGETLIQRKKNQTNDIVSYQLNTILSILDPSIVIKIVVAYEPVWAIGTGKIASPSMAQNVHIILRQQLAKKNSTAAKIVRILYGGSIGSNNAKKLLMMPDIDGGLIGTAALKAIDFLNIINIINNLD